LANGTTTLAELECALESVWPKEPSVQLLRACLLSGQPAREAWQRFAAHVERPKPFIEQDQTGLKGLLPLLHAAARSNGFEAEPGLWTYFRSAVLREELRYRVYRDLCGQVLGALVEAGLEVVALKACALAEIVYDEPALRHCHAIELLVADGDRPRAAPVLDRLGFRPARLREARPGRRQGFRHTHGLPLVLHVDLFDPPVYRSDTEALWSESVPATVAGVSVRALAPAHNLVHVLAAAYDDPQRGGLRWACDGWLLCRRLDGPGWQELQRHTQACRLELPVHTMLRFLEGALAAGVHHETLSSLGEAAGRSPRPAREAALSGAVGSLSAARGAWSRGLGVPAVRRDFLRFLLCPTTSYLRWRYGAAAAVPPFLLRAYRPLAYVARGLKWRLLGLAPFDRFTRRGQVAAEIEKARSTGTR